MAYQHPQNKFQYKIFLHFYFGLPYYSLTYDYATSQCSPYNSVLLNLLIQIISCFLTSYLLTFSTQEISCKTLLSSTIRRKKLVTSSLH